MLRTIDQLDLDLGNFAELQNGIVLPSSGGNASPIKPHLLLQNPAGRLNNPALNLVQNTVRIDHASAINRRHHADDANGFSDGDLGDHCRVITDIFVAGKADANTRRPITLTPWLPACFGHHGVNHRMCAFIVEMPKAKFNRVDLCGCSQFVHERFDRKDIDIGAQGTQRGGANGHGRDGVVTHIFCREIVIRHGIALASTTHGQRHVGRGGRLEPLVKMPSRQQPRLRSTSWPGNVSIAPNFFFPFTDETIRRNHTFEFDHHGGPQRLPSKLILSHPLHAQRLTLHSLGQQHRIKGGVIRTVVAITTRPFSVSCSHLIWRQLKNFRNFVT